MFLECLMEILNVVTEMKLELGSILGWILDL